MSWKLFILLRSRTTTIANNIILTYFPPLKRCPCTVAQRTIDITFHTNGGCTLTRGRIATSHNTGITLLMNIHAPRWTTTWYSHDLMSSTDVLPQTTSLERIHAEYGWYTFHGSLTYYKVHYDGRYLKRNNIFPLVTCTGRLFTITLGQFEHMKDVSTTITTLQFTICHYYSILRSILRSECFLVPLCVFITSNTCQISSHHKIDLCRQLSLHQMFTNPKLWM